MYRKRLADLNRRMRRQRPPGADVQAAQRFAVNHQCVVQLLGCQSGLGLRLESDITILRMANVSDVWTPLRRDAGRKGHVTTEPWHVSQTETGPTGS